MHYKQVIIFKKYRIDFNSNQFLLLCANNHFKSSDTWVPENLCSIHRLILVDEENLCILKIYGYFVVMLYILEVKSKR